MKSDPVLENGLTTIFAPPIAGKGSGKREWVAFAHETLAANQSLSDVISSQSETIRDLQAEIALLRTQIAKRKPTGGKPRLPDETIRRIETHLDRGLSLRAVAHQCRVSHQTVKRVKDRQTERQII